MKNLDKLTLNERAKYALIRLKNTVSRCPTNDANPIEKYIKDEILIEQKIIWDQNTKGNTISLPEILYLENLCERIEQQLEKYEKEI